MSSLSISWTLPSLTMISYGFAGHAIESVSLVHQMPMSQ
jgi:hypothetical protein